MSRRPLIVLTLEGLATAPLGCYGSSWNSTPTIDALASTGCLWDRWTATDDAPLAVLNQWMRPIDADQDWATTWRQRGPIELITDDPRVIEQDIPARFDQTSLVQPAAIDQPDVPATDIADTDFGRLVAEAIERDRKGSWSLLWLHSRFLGHRWDAPRELFASEEESDLQPPEEEVDLLDHPDWQPSEQPEPPPFIFPSVAPPQIKLDRPYHPDLITAWMHTYGCQIRLVDLLIDILLESLQVEDPQFVLAGTSGMALGQNGWIGHHVGPLRSCDLRLPLLVSDLGPIRWPHLTSSGQLPNLLKSLASDAASLISPPAWCQPIDEFTPAVATHSLRAEKVVTTPRWFFVRDSNQEDHLFLKPDDLEDANDVGRLRSDVVDTIVSDFG